MFVILSAAALGGGEEDGRKLSIFASGVIVIAAKGRTGRYSARWS
jgi:hypothetical protein